MVYLSGRIPLYLRIEQIELSVTDSAGDKRSRMKGRKGTGRRVRKGGGRDEGEAERTVG